jgi:hypothetical protein
MPPIAEHKLVVMRNWIHNLCHAMTCPHPDGTCPASKSCDVSKAILRHLIHCDPRTCQDVRCTEYKALLEHYVSCTVS